MLKGSKKIHRRSKNDAKEAFFGVPWIVIFPRNYNLFSFIFSLIGCLALLPLGAYSFQWKSFLAFIILGILTWFRLYRMPGRQETWNTIIAIGLPPFLLYIPFHLLDAENTVHHLPVFVIHFFGILSGLAVYLFAHTTKTIFVSFSLVFAALYSFPGYDLWVHKCTYGHFFPDINEELSADLQLSFVKADGNTISREQLRHKIVVLDFWHTGCGVCRKTFPEIQHLYNEYHEDPAVAFYSVNIPTEQDTTGQGFALVSKLNYSFPVVTPEHPAVMDSLGIDICPMVVIIDRSNRLVFRGSIEDAGERILELRTSTSVASY